jgi:translin
MKVDHMELERILEPLKTEIQNDDHIREKVLPLAREAVRKCAESVKCAHRKEYVAASGLIYEAQDILTEANREFLQSEFMLSSRLLDGAYQEIAEAANVVSLLSEGTFTPPQQHGIPSRPFLTGLADAVGELRRAVLDALRADEVERAEQLLRLMEETLDGLLSFDFPNALVPDLRRKCDVARSLVERTRGDLTAGVQQSKLIGELRGFEGRTRDDRKR